MKAFHICIAMGEAFLIGDIDCDALGDLQVTNMIIDGWVGHRPAKMKFVDALDVAFYSEKLLAKYELDLATKPRVEAI